MREVPVPHLCFSERTGNEITLDVKQSNVLVMRLHLTSMDVNLRKSVEDRGWSRIVQVIPGELGKSVRNARNEPGTMEFLAVP